MEAQGLEFKVYDLEFRAVQATMFRTLGRGSNGEGAWEKIARGVDARAERGRTDLTRAGCPATQAPSPSTGCCSGTCKRGRRAGVQSGERAASGWTMGWKQFMSSEIHKDGIFKKRINHSIKSKAGFRVNSLQFKF